MNQRRSSSAKIRLLLVEDNPGDRDLVLDLIERDLSQSVVAQVAESLEEAISLIEGGTLDIILLDLGLPGSSGVETFEKIKNVAPDTPIVVLTSSTDTAVGVACIEKGACTFLVKDQVESGIAVTIRSAITSSGLLKAIDATHRNLRQALDGATDAILVLQADGVVMFANSAAGDLFGGRVALGMQFGIPMNSAHAQELDVLHVDGSITIVDMRAAKTSWFDEPASIVSFRDISESKAAEHSIRRLNRVYAVLSRINALIVRVKERQVLYDESCEIAVREGQFDLAYICTVDPDDLSIKIVAAQGIKEDVELISEATFMAREDSMGSPTMLRKAALSGLPVCDNNMVPGAGNNPGYIELCQRGYCSAVSLPLKFNGKVVGVFGLCMKERGFFDAKELKLLAELAGDISFVIEVMQTEERVNFLAYHDPLTGLANRISLHERLSTVVAAAQEKHVPFALILINVNGFREINGTLGHHNGDVLINLIAERLTETVWESDLVASLGGAEFAVLIPRLSDVSHVDLVVAKIMKALRMVFQIDDLPVNVEARIGVSMYPDHGADADLLWQRADIAMRANPDRPGTHTLYHAEIDHFDPQRLALIGELSAAIDANELVLHWQPRVNLQTGNTKGMEALIRWQHPKRGLIYPDEFLPYVENTGLIHPLTSWVIGNALRQGRTWHKNGFPLDISINISARNLLDPNLTETLLEQARSARFPLELLTVEVTESAIMLDPIKGQAMLREMSEAGIRLSMDDFGTGQSSLTYLKDLPLHEMKIDKSFVMDYSNTRNVAIVRAAIELSHNLGLLVTAEGVEDEATLLALTDTHCDVAQGYHIGRPMAADKVVAWMVESSRPCTREPERKVN